MWILIVFFTKHREVGIIILRKSLRRDTSSVTIFKDTEVNNDCNLGRLSLDTPNFFYKMIYLVGLKKKNY